MDTPSKTLQSKEPSVSKPKIKWLWLTYILLFNSLVCWVLLQISTENSFIIYLEICLTVTYSLGGLLYALNRDFLKSWFWKIILWIILLHFVFITFALFDKEGISSLLKILAVATFYIPNAYLIFKVTQRNKTILKNNQPDENIPKSICFRLGRLFLVTIIIAVIIISFYSIFHFFDFQSNSKEHHKLETVLTTLYEKGVMHHQGNGVPQDDKKAVEFFLMAAEQGHMQSQSALASIYATSKGVIQNNKQALVWFLKAGEQGDAYSQYSLGNIYSNGLWVTKDEKEAQKWYLKAAKQGDSFSQFYLALLLEDDAESVKWLKKSANSGNKKAQFFLGLSYHDGRGIEQDDEQAANWFLKSAQQGYADGQQRFALMLYAGKGVEQDRKQALIWLEKSAQQGNKKAQQVLKKIEEKSDPNRLLETTEMFDATKKWLTSECKKEGFVPITMALSCKGSVKEFITCMENHRKTSSRKMSCGELNTQVSLCETRILASLPKQSKLADSIPIMTNFIECIIE